MDVPQILWKPTEDGVENSNLFKYLQWLNKNYDLSFEGYSDVYQWSIENLEDFWKTIWEYFAVKSYTPYEGVMSDDPMPGTQWFKGATLNYSEHIFRTSNPEHPAIIYKSEFSELEHISWKELESNVASFRSFLLKNGIQKGDRVVAFLPNTPEANIAFLAANSIGAIWSSSSPDFGTRSVIDRFAQIEPRILIATNGYQYGGKKFNKVSVVEEIYKNIPSLEKLVLLDYLEEIDQKPEIEGWTSWDSIMAEEGSLEFEPVEFEHPIWVLYSSGTTGKPKAITQSHGGILLEHLKYMAFHNDVKPGERCFWYTTTGWMMWNYIQASLLCGGTVVQYDGSPAYPDINELWKFAQDAKITHFGTSAGYVVANMKSGNHPARNFDLSALRSLGSTGSPLPPEGFTWIYEKIKKDIWLTSISGGTDVCSAFVGGNPFWPVYEGEIQCRALGCDLHALGEDGNPVSDEVGEMVIDQPMPSMPVYFWNDEGNKRYLGSYFDMYPGKWRHGDWIKITPRQGIVIYGRSDSTLNRGGVRIGTSEIYSAVDQVEEVADSLIICLEEEGGQFYMPLFVVMKEGVVLDEGLEKKIKTTIREAYSPRHVPDEIHQITEVPYTISGKKVETPVKKILMGMDPRKVSNPDALKNPGSLDYFVEFAKTK